MHHHIFTEIYMHSMVMFFLYSAAHGAPPCSMSSRYYLSNLKNIIQILVKFAIMIYQKNAYASLLQYTVG